MTITGRVRGHSLHRTRCLARVFRKSCLEGDGGKAAALTRVDNRGNAYILEIDGKKLFVTQCGMKELREYGTDAQWPLDVHASFGGKRNLE